MAMTNAERQAEWQARRKDKIRRLEQENEELRKGQPLHNESLHNDEEVERLKAKLVQLQAENERLRGGLRKAGGAAAVMAENDEVARLEEICAKQSDEIDKAWERVNDLEDAMSEIEGLALDVDEAVESHEGVKDALVALAVHVIMTMKPDDDSQKSIAALKAELPLD